MPETPSQLFGNIPNAGTVIKIYVFPAMNTEPSSGRSSVIAIRRTVFLPEPLDHEIALRCSQALMLKFMTTIDDVRRMPYLHAEFQDVGSVFIAGEHVRF